MSDNTPAAHPGWYPDTTAPGRQRYWDGAQWTNHYYPPLHPYAAPAAPPVKPTTRPRRRGLLVGLVAGGTAMALGLTAFLVWGLPGQPGGLVTEDDWDYAYAPAQEVEHDHSFTFPADYDLRAMAAANGDEFDLSFAFELFTDAALTRNTSLRANQWQGEIEVSGNTLPSATYYRLSGSESPITTREFQFNPAGMGFWGLHAEYFLVQKLDASGEPLEKPVVHPITIESALPTPEVGYSTSDDGTLQVEWRPVPGATEYLITVSSWQNESHRRDVEVVGITTETAWSPPMHDVFTGEEVAVDILQNDGLSTYRLWSADEVAGGGTTVNALDNDTTQYEYGVVATDGNAFSSLQPTDANGVAASLPHEIPLRSRKEQFPNGQSVTSLDDLSTRFFFTSLDGATRQTSAHIDPETVTGGTSSPWRLNYIGRGTALAWPVYLEGATRAEVDEQIAQFNDRATAEAPTTGMPAITVVAEAVDEDFDQPTPSTTAPDVDYPVTGSNEFTEYLAANLIAREDAIDVSDYENRVGMPALDDALGEAVYQNPYIIGFRGFNYRDGAIYITYVHDPAETARLQAEVAAVVEAAVASETTPEMGDVQIAEALNTWLIEVAEYDTPAFENSLFGYPDDFHHAWDASGVLLAENDNLGVCASYAAAYKALLDEAGVESVVVSGDVFDGGRHAWNKVRVEGQWLAVDPTWNDGPDPSAYLLITDAEFTGSALRAEGVDWMADMRIPDYATP
ncbi:DUF2510 domain-containing protein [Actinotalea sp. C106]|uniref:transglutaminase domain-containing protein n=1 Tax=Actinotalea sp. C106 TaxID=2908644 RepID=UPI002028B7E3|nr:DUF2510 domain-containing protein [Actinotalea sp. C106]